MQIEEVSSAADNQNEDLVAVSTSGDVTDILIMDGGTSVADRAYIDSSIGDAAWLVRSFAASLGKPCDPGKSQETSVRLAVEEVFASFTRITANMDVPKYAYPIAAMTWVRATRSDTGVELQIYALGDCKTLLRQPDGNVLNLDPFVNPQENVLRGEIAKLSAEGITDPAARWERLLPMLRARREFQNCEASPRSLCIAPRGPFTARRSTFNACEGAMLLVMTDGFYRLVDTYKLYSDAQLAELCLENGLQAAMERLRAFEGAAIHDKALKSADDASAVVCLFS